MVEVAAESEKRITDLDCNFIPVIRDETERFCISESAD